MNVVCHNLLQSHPVENIRASTPTFVSQAPNCPATQTTTINTLAPVERTYQETSIVANAVQTQFGLVGAQRRAVAARVAMDQTLLGLVLAVHLGIVRRARSLFVLKKKIQKKKKQAVDA